MKVTLGWAGLCWGPQTITAQEGGESLGLAGGGKAIAKCKAKFTALLELLVRIASLQVSGSRVLSTVVSLGFAVPGHLVRVCLFVSGLLALPCLACAQELL